MDFDDLAKKADKWSKIIAPVAAVATVLAEISANRLTAYVLAGVAWVGLATWLLPVRL